MWLFELFDLMREYLCSCKSDNDSNKLKSELINMLSSYDFYEFAKYLTSNFSSLNSTINWYLILERCLKIDINYDYKYIMFSFLLIDGIAIDVSVKCINNELAIDIKLRKWEI